MWLGSFWGEQMLFHDVAEQIQDGDFLFFRGKAIYTRVIKFWTQSRYSHVAVAVWIKQRLFVAEAVEGRGVQLYPLDKYLKEGCEVDWFKVTDNRVDRSRVVAWFVARIGNRYASPRQLVRSFVTLPIANLFGLTTKIDRDRWFCSFASVEALKHGYGMIAGDVISEQAETASPGDVSYLPALHIQGTLLWKEPQL